MTRLIPDFIFKVGLQGFKGQTFAEDFASENRIMRELYIVVIPYFSSNYFKSN